MSWLKNLDFKWTRAGIRLRARRRLWQRALRERARRTPRELGSSALLGPEERQVLLTEATELLNELAQIDSSQTQGVRLVQSFMATELEHLGFRTTLISNPKFDSAEFVLADLSRGPKYVTLVAHADTVLPPFDPPFVLFDEGQKAHGSGVIDNKGGLLVALLGLRLFLKQHPAPSFSIRFAISPNEERGSQGFIELYRKLAEDTWMALGFEPSLDDGSIIESRRGNRWYEVTVTGLEAHAGRSQGHHINAAHELSRKIYHLGRLSDEKKNVSVNVGSLQGGGGRYNIICGQAQALLDVRFSDFEGRDHVTKSIEKILDKKFHSTKDQSLWASTSYKVVDDCPPFEVNKISRVQLKTMLRLIEKVEGAKVTSLKAGGAGDVNYLSQPGTVVMDGLGAKGGQMHTEDEFVVLSSLVTRAEALALFLMDIEQKHQT